MSIFENVAAATLIIDAENERISKEEGFDYVPQLTGKMFYTFQNEAVWFEIVDPEYHTTSLVSLDFPLRTAMGEKLVGVDDYSEAILFDTDNE